MFCTHRKDFDKLIERDQEAAIPEKHKQIRCLGCQKIFIAHERAKLSFAHTVLPFQCIADVHKFAVPYSEHTFRVVCKACKRETFVPDIFFDINSCEPI